MSLTPVMYAAGDRSRFVAVDDTEEPYRSPWRRDHARVIHCASWRRLQGKTQLFPGSESDFFRNRLTHSLEVAQIAKSISIRLNHTEEFLKQPGMALEPEIAEIAALCHDIGHPPFGHTGEDALDVCMRPHGGFEGNAQTLRVVARLEKRERGECTTLTGVDESGVDHRRGLNLSFRVLASMLKYDRVIPQRRKANVSVQKGYYEIDSEIITTLKEQVGAPTSGHFKTIECSVMDLADDIAYSTYDLEDALKAGFVTPLSMVSADVTLLERVAAEVAKALRRSSVKSEEVAEVLLRTFRDVFEGDADRTHEEAAMAAFRAADLFSSNSYLRTKLTSQLVGQFIRGVVFEPSEDQPWLSKVKFSDETALQVEVLKNFTYQSLIMSPRLRIVSHRGREIVTRIFEALADFDKDGHQLLPNDFRDLYLAVGQTDRERVITDFIAGMTDRYALEFYGRLTSERPETIFKPT